jgi:hypothetical protein
MPLPHNAEYPPEPWHLRGSLLVSAFAVPVAALPASFAGTFPPRRRPLAFGGHALVGVAFANYGPGGVLAYDELLAAVPSLRALRLRYTIPQIWVNSAASRVGGRELWAIPKDLATFQRTTTTAGASISMTLGDHAIASVTARYQRLRVPGVLRLTLPIVQATPGRRVLSNNIVAGRMSALSTSWKFDPDGPLGYLAGRRPLASIALRDGVIMFGTDVKRSQSTDN